MTPQEQAAIVREALTGQSGLKDLAGPRCRICGAALDSEHRAGCNVPAAFAALDALVAERDALATGLTLAIAAHWELCNGCEHCQPARDAIVRAAPGEATDDAA